MAKRQTVLLSIIVVGGVFSTIVMPHAVHAEDKRAPLVRVFEMQKGGSEQSTQHEFFGFDASDLNGGTVAVGDVNGDGAAEVVVGSGAGSAPQVRVYSMTGTLLSSFVPYDAGMTSGVNVAVGDLNNDGRSEIVTGTGKGAGPQVRVFNSKGKVKFTPGFFAYDQAFRGGVSVATGNINGKGGDEIITGAGPGGGPHVRVFNKKGNSLNKDFFPFSSSDHGGVSVGTANVDGGAEDEIIMAMHSFGEPWVKVYKADSAKTILGEFKAYNDDFFGGVNVAGADVNRDGLDEVITSVRQAGGPQVRMFSGSGDVVAAGFMAYEDDFRGGAAIAAGNIDADGKAEVVTIPQRKLIDGRTDLYKYIDVDLSEQTLRAYRDGVKENEFLVSTGVARYPTPTGETKITAKLLSHDYEWSYGIDHPDNYDLPDVPYNLRFRSTYYIHNAYWHNNFGHVMSHGCVNVNLENSKWIYEWADVGDTVVIHE
jgi:lipoprotein-anchoring transpeptidase ErfK/SrfK